MKKILSILLKTIGAVLGIVVLYCLFALALPLIQVPEEKTSDPKTVETYILTNGVHTDLVVPIKTAYMDWSQEIPFENTLSKRNDFKYLSVGWGDKGFYLDTPTWADLKFSTAFRAAFWLSESAMHCTFYDKMTLGKDCKKIMMTPEQYARLTAFIKEKFDRDARGKVVFINTKSVYGKNDAFYDAKGRYSFLETCNTWSNEGLKKAGQKAALWTASDFGIFRHYE